MIGDLIYRDLNRDKRLVCDGSLVSTEAYPELGAVMQDASLDLGYDFTQAAVSGIPTAISLRYTAAISPDSEILMFGGVGTSSNRLNGYRISDWSRVTDLPNMPGTVNGLSFSPDGTYLAITHLSGNGLTVLDATTFSIIPGTPALAGDGMAVEFSPDGSLLYVAHNGGQLITVLRTDDWTVVETGLVLPGNGNNAGKCLSVSSDGKKLLVGFSNYPPYSHIVNTETWEIVNWLTTPGVNSTSCRLSPNGRWAVVGGSTGSRVGIIDMETLERVGTSVSAPGKVNDVVFSPDSEYLVCLFDGAPYMSVWKTSSWTQLSSIELPGNGQGAVFSEKHGFLAVAHSLWPFNGIYPVKATPPEGYFYVPTIPAEYDEQGNPLPVLIQAED